MVSLKITNMQLLFILSCCSLFVFLLRLLEQQLQAWRLTVQSDQDVLEDRCAEMELTMETLRQYNIRSQGMLTQVMQLGQTEAL